MFNCKKIIVLGSALIVILTLVGASCAKKTAETSTNPTVAGTSTDQSYFSEDAKVMFFYSDLCSWCKKEKEILKELVTEGYKVKPMDVAKDTGLWQQYNIEGTPTFIAPDGTRLVGYQDKEKLKAFLDKYK